VRLGEYVYLKYINVSFVESSIAMKSEERNYKSDSSEGEGKLWDPDFLLGRKKKICVQTRWACPMLVP
jgi:hypothetical protein